MLENVGNCAIVNGTKGGFDRHQASAAPTVGSPKTERGSPEGGCMVEWTTFCVTP